jgi:agarase
MFGAGLVAASNQDARAQMYSEYVLSVASNPAFVGCHWFKYSDQPLTGAAADGENFNIGFVSVADAPYPEMVSAARKTYRRVREQLTGASPSTASGH